MSNKKDKLARIAQLKKQIEAIEGEAPESYELVKVEPDGGGICDYREVVAVSGHMQLLINYCEVEYSYSPSLNGIRPKSDKNYLGTWFEIRESDIAILG